MVGVTITVAVPAGFVPELAVHTNGAAPLEDRETLCPTHIVDNEGVILIDGVKEIDTVATAVAVHVPAPDKTVYVVVVVGLTVTEAALGGLAPELAVQTNGAEPLDVNVTLCPIQIVDREGVILIEGVKEIDTVATA